MNSAKTDQINVSYLLVISIIAALGGLMFGFDVAIISGTITFIKEYFVLDELQLGWGVSSLLVGCIAGAMFAGNLSDRFGRKRMLIITALFFAIKYVPETKGKTLEEIEMLWKPAPAL